MISVQQNQLMTRWDSLPDDLRDAMVSDANSDFISKICDEEHVTDEKADAVLRIAGYVLAGFIHPGDFGREIKEATQLNPIIADAVAKAIGERIFDPLRTELDEIFEPPLPLLPIASIPVPLADMKGAHRQFSLTTTQSPALAPVPPPPPVLGKNPERQAPATSGGSSEAPKSFSDFAKPLPSQAPRGNLGETMPPPPKPAGRTAPPVPETQAAPKIIQEEVEFKPLRQSSGFGINIDLPKSLNATPEKEKVPAKPAVIEFSGQQAKPAEAPIRVVHYSEFRTPLAKPPESPAAAGTSSSAPKPSSGEREVHEVTAMPGAAAAPVIYGSTAIPPKPFASFPTPPTPQPMPAPKPFVAPPQSSPINFMKPAILPVPPVPPSQTPLPPKISVGFSPPPASKPVPPPAPFVPSAPSVSKPNPPVSNPLPHLFDEKELPPG